ncbi:MAG: hypothetical protein JST89_00550 [Cyanobacteria bacterium SZAS-4]|nr:hypothetical protein [Cyanobacteria bacterium SZAS-4]
MRFHTSYLGKHFTVVAIAISIFTMGALPSFSETRAHHTHAKHTDYGDGIKMVEAPDQSGFVITTDNGASLSFTLKNQQVVFTLKDGSKKVFTFVDHTVQDIVKSDAPLIVNAASHQ